jgi:hypothetical protein
MLAVAANDGGYGASLQTLTPYIPPNEGNPGVYVPPSNRPAMTPTWGSVKPIGISSVTLAGLKATVPVAFAATGQGLTSQAYSLQVLQTECQGSRTGLPSMSRAPAGRRFRPRALQRRPHVQTSGYAAAAGPLAADRRPHRHPGGTDLLDTARATATVGRATAAGIGAGRSSMRTLHGGP